MDFVQIPSGTFRMGLRGFAEPIHEVVVSGFWIGKYEVTNEQFDRFHKRPRPPESLRENMPVTRLKWKEAAEFCAWLSRKEHRDYRLPTEAQWEYAARGGLDQKLNPWGDGADWQGRANFGSVLTMPVGSFRPNGYGLFDMAGNVAEYVSDFYDEKYYRYSPRKDPKGPERPGKIRRGRSVQQSPGIVQII